MTADTIDTAVHQLQSSIPQGLNHDDNATLLQSVVLNHLNQIYAIQRQGFAQSYGVPGVPPGSGIAVSHVHSYPAPSPAPAPVADDKSPSWLSRLGWPAALMLGSGIAGIAGTIALRDQPTPIIAPTSTSKETSITNTTAAPPLLPPAKDPNYKIGVE
jgi:hypothetical protein